jgi:hypothetical protein
MESLIVVALCLHTCSLEVLGTAFRSVLWRYFCTLRVGCIVRLLIRRVNNHHSIIMRRLGARPPWSYSSSQYQQSANLISSLLPSSGPLRLPPPDNYPDFCVALYSPLQTHSPVFSYLIEWRTSKTRFQLIGLLSWYRPHQRDALSTIPCTAVVSTVESFRLLSVAWYS